MNTPDKIIVKHIFENIQKGVYPKFGSPETKCNKCMFYGVACMPKSEYVGCYGGWKRKKE